MRDMDKTATPRWDAKGYSPFYQSITEPIRTRRCARTMYGWLLRGKARIAFEVISVPLSELIILGFPYCFTAPYCGLFPSAVRS